LKQTHFENNVDFSEIKPWITETLLPSYFQPTDSVNGLDFMKLSYLRILVNNIRLDNSSQWVNPIQEDKTDYGVYY
jgi:hypothetical protein